MKNPDERADEVLGVGVGAEIAAGYRRNDKPLAGDVFDEEQHPSTEAFERRHECQSWRDHRGLCRNGRRATLRVFVTGAAGFFGTELVTEFIAAGHQVRGQARGDAGAEQWVPS